MIIKKFETTSLTTKLLVEAKVDNQLVVSTVNNGDLVQRRQGPRHYFTNYYELATDLGIIYANGNCFTYELFDLLRSVCIESGLKLKHTMRQYQMMLYEYLVRPGATVEWMGSNGQTKHVEVISICLGGNFRGRFGDGLECEPMYIEQVWKISTDWCIVDVERQ